MNASRRQLLLVVGAGLLVPPARAVMAPLDLLLARLAPPVIDPAPYLVSEKFDGVRALWDGQRRRFRSGREVSAPRWFTGTPPVQSLDGELWLGRSRGRFDALSAAVRRAEPIDAEWRALRYLVFEAPGQPGHFAARHAQLQRCVTLARHPQLQAVDQQRLPDRAALQARYRQVLAAGGEGLMLHRADASYVGGRSDLLLKRKAQLDTKARVVGHVAGQGRHAGRPGALDSKRRRACASGSAPASAIRSATTRRRSARPSATVTANSRRAVGRD